MKTILVLVDFSKAAFNAVNYAVEVAMTCKASLFLLYVCDLPVNFTQVPVSLDIDDERLNAEAELIKLKVKIHERTRGDLNIFSEVRNGNFFSEVKSFCEYVRPYIVIMGSQGTSIMEKLVLGGHAVYEMQHLPCTSLAVPCKMRFSEIKKVALAWDFQNPMDRSFIEKIGQLISDFGAELHVISVIIGEKDLLQLRIKTLKSQMEFSRLAPVFHCLEGKKTSKSIMEYVENNGFDLLVLFPGEYSLFEELIFPTHTKKLVLHCSVPIMALHP
ncbi:universal stress protein [Niabella beijingensis]|uniref:universal stress protein n=1 Tax=Niabella beijingensis TaxID=2872700 RepID=UPI001CBE784D|nr:universal stress protein [Niabella beijingensis]MBZ4191624.1 universal stress protein [Niabella beijingensis]